MEIEIKFSPVSSHQATALFAERTLSQPMGEKQLLRMETTYYDDPAHILSGHGFTFRLRQENEKRICTFKTRLSGMSRLELETEAADIAEGARLLAQHSELPEEARAVLEAGTFLPTCGASFVRLVQPRQANRVTMMLSWDAGVLFRENILQPFTEAELELVTGEEEMLRVLAERYRVRFGLTVCHRSKQQRAWALERERSL